MSVRDRIKMFEKAPSTTGSVVSSLSGKAPSKTTSPTNDLGSSFLPRPVAHSDADQHTPKSVGSTASVGKRGTPPSVSPSVHQPVWKKAFDVPPHDAPVGAAATAVVEETEKITTDEVKAETPKEELAAVTIEESKPAEVVEEPVKEAIAEVVHTGEVMESAGAPSAVVVEEIIVSKTEEVVVATVDEVMVEKQVVEDSDNLKVIVSDSPLVEKVPEPIIVEPATTDQLLEPAVPEERTPKKALVSPTREVASPALHDPLAKNLAFPDEPIEVTPEVIAAVKQLNESNSIDHTTLLDKPLFPKPPLYTE